VMSGSSYYSHNDLRLHFGLGTAAQADRIEVSWPSGSKDVVENISANQRIVIEEGKGVVKREQWSARRRQA
jgi:enediyne biosynthesis protein E4